MPNDNQTPLNDHIVVEAASALHALMYDVFKKGARGRGSWQGRSRGTSSAAQRPATALHLLLPEQGLLLSEGGVAAACTRGCDGICGGNHGGCGRHGLTRPGVRDAWQRRAEVRL